MMLLLYIIYIFWKQLKQTSEAATVVIDYVVFKH